MNAQDRELSMEELNRVVGGSDFLFRLQQATNAASQAETQASNTAKWQRDTTASILRNLHG